MLATSPQKFDKLTFAESTFYDRFLIVQLIDTYRRNRVSFSLLDMGVHKKGGLAVRYRLDN